MIALRKQFLLLLIPYLGTISISGITENAGESGDATVTFSVSMTWNPDWEEVSLGEQ